MQKVEFKEGQIPEFLIVGNQSIKEGIIEERNGSMVFVSGTFKQVLSRKQYNFLVNGGGEKVFAEAEEEVEEEEVVEVGLEELTKDELIAEAEKLYGEGNVDKRKSKSLLIELINDFDGEEVEEEE